jgi:hypothetical protein
VTTARTADGLTASIQTTTERDDMTTATEQTAAATTDKSPKKADAHETKMLRLVLTGRSGSPLVIHAFAEKAKQEIRDKQRKEPKQAKAKRDPGIECQAAKYLDAEGCECAPITAIKKSMISAATAFDNLTKVALRQAIFVSPTADASSMLVRIERLDGRPAVGTMREDAVTIGINTRGLTYRPEYPEWRLRVTVEFNPRLVSLEQVVALAQQAGWGVGICEGRPERSSALGWGRFDVTVDEAA